MNEIREVQITAPQIGRLRAQRRLYSSAKTLLGLQVVLSVPFAVAWSTAGIFFPGTKAYAALWGIAVTLLDVFVFTPRQKTLKTKAAKIQEAFDCDVLVMEWRSIRVGSRPDPEDVIRWSARKELSPQDMQDPDGWYPQAVSALPVSLARVVCQRANFWWDAELRRRYAAWVIGVVAVIFGISTIAGVIGHFPLDQWVLGGIAPLLPVSILGIRQYKEQREAADRLDVLRGHAERLWREALAGANDEVLAEQSRELQDELFDHRRRNPLIFDWIYARLRSRQEEQMNRTAEELVEEARKKLQLGGSPSSVDASA
jgi:hypothetical protein